MILPACILRAMGEGHVTNGATQGLARSSLTLDQAAANIVTWGIGFFDEAAEMTSHRVVELLKDALDFLHVEMPAMALEWGEGLTKGKMCVGNFERDVH